MPNWCNRIIDWRFKLYFEDWFVSPMEISTFHNESFTIPNNWRNEKLVYSMFLQGNLFCVLQLKYLITKGASRRLVFFRIISHICLESLMTKYAFKMFIFVRIFFLSIIESSVFLLGISVDLLLYEHFIPKCAFKCAFIRHFLLSNCFFFRIVFCKFIRSNILK